MTSLPEPWLRGPLEGVAVSAAPILRSFEMAAEDLALATAELTAEQLWARPGGAGSVGFHIRHIGGSIDRLLSYAEGRQLSDAQLAQLRQESEPRGSRDQLLLELMNALSEAAERVRAIDPATFEHPRGVGRKQLPTSVIGLLIHVAEHTQRHVGQAVTMAKVVRALTPRDSTEPA